MLAGGAADCWVKMSQGVRIPKRFPSSCAGLRCPRFMARPAHRVRAAQRTSRRGSLRGAGLRAARAGLLHVCHSVCVCAHYGCVQHKAVPQLQAFSLDDSGVDQLLTTVQKLKNDCGRSLCLSSPVRPLVPPGSLLHGGSSGESCSQRPCFLYHGAPSLGAVQP